MNVYDFDNTICGEDSTARFFAYCLRHYPAMWLDLPGQAVNGALFLLKLRPKQAFKERMLGFLRRIGDVDAAVERFWAKNFSRVKPVVPREAPAGRRRDLGFAGISDPAGLRAARRRLRDGLAG